MNVSEDRAVQKTLNKENQAN